MVLISNKEFLRYKKKERKRKERKKKKREREKMHSPFFLISLKFSIVLN